MKKQQIIDGVKLPATFDYTFNAGQTFGKHSKNYREVVVDNKVLRVFLIRVHKIIHANGFFSGNNYTPRKSILKNNRNETPKSVKFNDHVTVTSISPRKSTDSSSDDSAVLNNSFKTNGNGTPVTSRTSKTRKRSLTPLFKNGELKKSKNNSNKKINSFYNKQLKTTKMTTEEGVKLNEDDQKENIEAEVKTENGESENTTTNEIAETKPQIIKYEIKIDRVRPKPEFESVEEFLVAQTPKRKRGRPRKNHLDPDPPFSPFGTPKKKPCIPPKKPTAFDSSEPKRKRGRPRKNKEFGYHNICNDVDSIALPSELWSASVSAGTKKSQVTFMRIVEDAVSIRCDRSVKFIGGKNYYVKMNKRFVELVGAPKTVESLKEIEVLLGIVNDLNMNDPILRYYVR